MSEEQNKRDQCAEVQGSPYLIACDEQERERRKEWLYEILGPVFFGEKEAADAEELRQLFQEKYGIDVQHDFVEGDEHYDEYLEAQQAIAEGIAFTEARSASGTARWQSLPSGSGHAWKKRTGAVSEGSTRCWKNERGYFRFASRKRVPPYEVVRPTLRNTSCRKHFSNMLWIRLKKYLHFYA